MKRFNYLTLAALMAVAACDEGVDPVVAPVTGTIVGVVTIEAEAAVGVSVTLSSGPTTTTDAAGAFQFDDIVTGSYTVTISGFAGDATFTTTFKAATISSAGQVVTANFDGSYVRTSAIIGSVDVGGNGIPGVSIAIGGMAAAGTITDTYGDYSFSGLRAGSYTVEMSNWNEASYDFGTTSASVTLATGASEIVLFEGSLVTTASISGALFIDEFSKDSILNSGLEDNLAIANVPVTLEGILVLDTMTVLTDATGAFTFSNLAAGSYRIEAKLGTLIPGMLTLAGTNPQTTTVASGENGTVNFPFSITTQTVNVSGFLGIDGTNPGVTAISGWTINLYDTQSNAAAGTTTGRLGTGATTVAGLSTFRFLRSLDVGPNAASNDELVFAQVAGAPTGSYTVNGETIIEIPYASKDSSTMAADTFDALYEALTVAFLAVESDLDSLAWNSDMRANPDTAGAATSSQAHDSVGFSYYNITPALLTATSDGALPDTLHFRLSATQAAANGHAFTQVASAEEGTAAGSYATYIWDGTILPSDTVWVGTSTVTYTDVNILVGVHHEVDDSTDAATYTLGDGVLTTPEMQLYNTTTGTAVAAGGPFIVGTGGKDNEVTFYNVAVSGTREVRARSGDVLVDVLGDTAVSFTMDGSDQVDTVGALTGSGGPSTFAVKWNNTAIHGTVRSVDGVTAVGSMRVTVSATSDNILSGRTDTTVTTAADGTYRLDGLREGPYTVTVQDSAGVWAFTKTLTTLEQDGNVASDNAIPAAGVTKAGAVAANTDAFNGTRETEGSASTVSVQFVASRQDTKIEGVVVNDRDGDFDTLDPNEALVGAVITLYDDADGDGVVDTGEAIVAVDTTDAAGAYAFSGLAEDNYVVSAGTVAGSTVLRTLSKTGVLTNTTGVRTTAITGTGATLNQNNTSQVGDVAPAGQYDEFPRWSYKLGTAVDDTGTLSSGAGPNATNSASTIAPTHFVHLFNNGTVKGTVKVGSTGQVGVRVTIARCQTAAETLSPPAPRECTIKHTAPSAYIKSMDTDASGLYTFTNLLEGVWQIDVFPGTAGYTTIVTPDGSTTPQTYLATLSVSGGIETVPDFVIS